ncbi:MAG: hypothetical protein ACR2PR_07545 [Pseudohongiellaceae bacterium]
MPIKDYQTFVVLETMPELGEVLLEWTDTNDPDGPKYAQVHKLPLQAEAESWDESQYRQYFISQVAQVVEIPQWMFDEEERETQARLRLKNRTRLATATPTR